MKATGETLAQEAMKLPDRSIPYRKNGSSLKGMDCQGLVEYCLGQLGIRKDWKGSNAMWRDMVWRGTPEEAVKAFGSVPKGALLFILEQDGGEVARGYRDQLGNASHVGIYTGQGDGAVHASASRGCVCSSKFRGRTIAGGGWNRVGLCGLLAYPVTLENQAVQTHDEQQITRIVFSSNGGKVRLRKKPSTSAQVLERLAVGTEVEVLEEGTVWSRVRAGGRQGYMMSEFLRERTA